MLKKKEGGGGTVYFCLTYLTPVAGYLIFGLLTRIRVNWLCRCFILVTVALFTLISWEYHTNFTDISSDLLQQ